MLKTIIVAIPIILTAVNLILLWQIYRKMKQSMDKKLETIAPCISFRLTVFGINMVIICAILIGRSLLQLFLRA